MPTKIPNCCSLIFLRFVQGLGGDQPSERCYHLRRARARRQAVFALLGRNSFYCSSGYKLAPSRTNRFPGRLNQGDPELLRKRRSLLKLTLQIGLAWQVRTRSWDTGLNSGLPAIIRTQLRPPLTFTTRQERFGEYVLPGLLRNLGTCSIQFCL